MGDIGVLIVSAAAGVLTLIFSRLRCRWVTQVDSEGRQTHTSACGFSDKPIVDEKLCEEIVPRPGSVLVMKRQ